MGCPTFLPILKSDGFSRPDSTGHRPRGLSTASTGLGVVDRSDWARPDAGH